MIAQLVDKKAPAGDFLYKGTFVKNYNNGTGLWAPAASVSCNVVPTQIPGEQ